ncbi:MAG: LacI family DNA-binding transcriptional regulator [Atopobiaceae bacterium]|nr:LacI family DNA-binding transcriptional regulator [Atopobiaceae bacterium]
MARKPSVREIARICEVSPSTVSRVLNHTGSISPETARRVMEVAREMGYVLPSERENTPPVVGIVHPHSNINVMTQVEQRLEAQLAAEDHDVLYANYRVRQGELVNDAIRRQMEHLLRAGVKALVLCVEDPEAISLPPLGIPVVLFNLERSDVRNSRYPYVSYDYLVGARLAADELLLKGCERPIVLLNSHYTPGRDGRYEEFCQVFADAGHPIPRSHLVHSTHTRSSFGEAHDAIRYLTASRVDFDGVFAGSDWRAYGALTALRELGIDVPDKVKVIGFDGSEIARHNSQPITSIVCDPTALAAQLKDMVMAGLTGAESTDRAIVPVQLFQGETT